MNDKRNIPVLSVNGKRFDGWTSAQIDKSLYQMTGAFGLSVTDKYPGHGDKWDFKLGDKCVVEINGQSIIKGYIEDIPIAYDSESHSIQVGGRDKTADLVDCSFVKTKVKSVKPKSFWETSNETEFSGQSLLSIVKALCKPYNINVVVDSSVTDVVKYIVPESFKANEGDVVFDLIISLCNAKAILPVSYGDGKLTLTRAGTVAKASDALEFGVNIISAAMEQSNKDRFQKYIVKGQGVGKDAKSLFATTNPSGEAWDNVILRYRPMVFFLETAGDLRRCKDRASWEARNRAGKSRSIEYIVQGWTQTNGKVWPLNSLVNVKDDLLGVHKELLIASTSFTLDVDGGSVTSINVVDPETFKLIETPIEGIATKFDWSKYKRVLTETEEIDN